MQCPQCGELCNFTINDVCMDCYVENKESNEETNKLIKKGHTEHCAKRMVWGDGECECHLRSSLN